MLESLGVRDNLDSTPVSDDDCAIGGSYVGDGDGQTIASNRDSDGGGTPQAKTLTRTSAVLRRADLQRHHRRKQQLRELQLSIPVHPPLPPSAHSSCTAPTLGVTRAFDDDALRGGVGQSIKFSVNNFTELYGFELVLVMMLIVAITRMNFMSLGYLILFLILLFGMAPLRLRLCRVRKEQDGAPKTVPPDSPKPASKVCLEGIEGFCNPPLTLTFF